MSGAAEQPVLDSVAMERLKRVGGPALAAQMIDLFVEQAPLRIGLVRAGLNGGSPAEAERGAHSLKSTAGNVGAGRLMAAARVMEDALAAGDVATARAAQEALERTLEDALAALALVRGELGP